MARVIFSKFPTKPKKNSALKEQIEDSSVLTEFFKLFLMIGGFIFVSGLIFVKVKNIPSAKNT